MGRYKERETTKFSDTIPIPPPSVYRFEIEDTKTGRIGEGVGLTKKEARDNTWKDLKFGEEPKYREKPISSSGGGGGVDVGALISVGEFPIGIIGFILLLLLAILIYFWASLLIWFGLFAMCFVLIFIKPLRGILGFGIAALSLYLAVRLGMEGGETPSNIPVWIACSTLIWLAPLMALAKKPLYVLLAFVCFGIVASFFFLGVPYLVEYHPELFYKIDKSPGEGILVILGMLLTCIVLLIIGFVIPFRLMAEAFSGADDL